MHHTAVESSNIHSVGYDANTRVLEVHFKSGARYHYHNVDAASHAKLMAAGSIGAHLHQHIKPRFKATPVQDD